jgi:acetate kinase
VTAPDSTGPTARVTGPTGPEAQVLVLNCGSSSVKYRLLTPSTGHVAATGLVERIGSPAARLEHRLPAADGTTARHEHDGLFDDHTAALAGVLAAFAEHGPDLDQAPLAAVGHRVVHGGTRFDGAVLIDDELVTAVDGLSVMAPLHNPANLVGIRTALAAFENVPHVAVFDTAFHHTLPDRACTYPVPELWREKYGVRRYGFHGSSYAAVTREAAALLGRDPDRTNLIVAHLGNGASACAVEAGRSIDTTMGLTPVGGLMMGTRSGDVDPALSAHLARVAGLDALQVERSLNADSGLLAVAGASDLREVEQRAEAGDHKALLALDMYSYRIRCCVGAYYAALGRVDAVVFTGGVGENSARVRHDSTTGLDRLGILLDEKANRDRSRNTARSIARPDSPVQILVVPTDEDREIARQALAALRTTQH